MLLMSLETVIHRNLMKIVTWYRDIQINRMNIMPARFAYRTRYTYVYDYMYIETRNHELS